MPLPKFVKRVLAGGKHDSVTRSVGDHPLVIEQVERIDLQLSPDAPHEERQRAVREAVSLFARAKTEGPIGLVAPAGTTLLRSCRLPPVAPHRIPDIIRYEADQMIPFELDEVEWRYFHGGIDGSPDIECCIVARKRELVQNDLAPFSDRVLQRRVDLLQVSELTFADYLWSCYMARGGKRNQGFLLGLSMDVDNTNLVVTDGSILWGRVIPIGSRVCGETPIPALRVVNVGVESEGLAEALLAETLAAEAQSPATAKCNAAADLVCEIQRSVGFWSATHQRCNLTAVTYHGEGFELPGLKAYVDANLGLEKVEIPFAQGLRKSLGLQRSIIQEHGASMTDALTVAMQRLGIGRFRINLHPDYEEPYGLGAHTAWGIAVQQNALLAVQVSRDS